MSTPIAISIAVVRQADRVLIGQRPAGAALAGLWEFPGGKVQPGETPPEAALRECLEETGIAARAIGELARVEHDYPHGRLKLTFFDCQPVDTSVQPRTPFRWIPITDLPRYQFPPANADVLRLLAAEAAEATP